MALGDQELSTFILPDLSPNHVRYWSTSSLPVTDSVCCAIVCSKNLGNEGDQPFIDPRVYLYLFSKVLKDPTSCASIERRDEYCQKENGKGVGVLHLPSQLLQSPLSN